MLKMENGFDEKIGRKLFFANNSEQKAGGSFLIIRRSKIVIGRSSVWIPDKGGELMFDVAFKSSLCFAAFSLF